MSRFKVASLFSGAGGLDWGFREAGFEIRFANDVAEHACRTYSQNFRLRLAKIERNERVEATEGHIFSCDVAQVDFSGLRGEVNVVVGGPPCQDFSVARGPDWDRRGIEVRRGRLYAHFVRALVQLQPEVFVFENVPGLVSANGGLAYRTILEDFRRLNLRWDEVRRDVRIADSGNGVHGYEIVFSQIVDFADLGVPQRRERLIVVGVRSDLAGRGADLLVEIRGRFESALAGGERLFRKYPLTPIEVFEGRPLPELQDSYAFVMEKWRGVWDEVGTNSALEWKKDVWDKLTLDAVRDYLIVNGVGHTDESELEEAWREHRRILRELGYLGRPVCLELAPDGTCGQPYCNERVAERMRRIPPGENHEFVRGTEWEVEGRGISLVYRRIHPLKPSYTLVAYGGGGSRGYHYDRDRVALKLREKARLQTFPDSFVFRGSRAEVRAQIGEAVPPLAGKRIAETVENVLRMIRQG